MSKAVRAYEIARDAAAKIDTTENASWGWDEYYCYEWFNGFKNGADWAMKQKEKTICETLDEIDEIIKEGESERE